VERRPDAGDWRRNVVVLTGAGQAAMAEGVQVAEAAEQRFLSKLSAADVASLKAALQALVF
jgi:DNA-binding MarR family transcriptional regulator